MTRKKTVFGPTKVLKPEYIINPSPTFRMAGAEWNFPCAQNERVDIVTSQELLKKYFGYQQFRANQQEIISQIQAGRDIMAVMPTGAGKSICYQIPALQFPGLTLVISPLISLMKDQVDALQQSGVPCAFLNSSLGEREYCNVMWGASAGQFKLLYVAPERLDAPGFSQLLQTLPISMVAVDEAHCVSQWGHDFRPSYTKIAEMVSQFPKRPIMAAFTATATELVRRDIIGLLSLQNPFTVVSDFNRPNLFFGVERPQNRMEALVKIIQQHPGESGIVYCITRKITETVCQALRSRGVSAAFYHGGLTSSERESSQEDFVYDRVQIMVATNAFGMGIDKPNVRFVLHYNMPKNMESYYQEAGRAGRDGDPAECILFFSRQDVLTNTMLIENSSEKPEPSAYRKLMEMEDYCHTDKCLRSYILEYFGQSPLADSCHNCSSCNSTAQTTDMTIEAQKILSCVKRMGERFGSTMVTNVLYGSKRQSVERFGFHKLSTYGIMKDYSQNDIREMISYLVSEGYLSVQGDQRPYLTLSPKAVPVLRGKEKVTIRRSIRQKEAARVETAENSELFQLLRERRQKLAAAAGVPAYIIFGDATLRAMSKLCPAVLEDMLDIPGIGQKKLEKYGMDFLEVIRQYRAQHPEIVLPSPTKKAPAPDDISNPLSAAGKSDSTLHQKDGSKVRRTHETLRDEQGNRILSQTATYALYQMGKSPEEIAELRGLSLATVETHLLTMLFEGKPVDYVFATPEQQKQVMEAWNQGFHTYREINEYLPEPFRFCTVQYTLYKNHLTLERRRAER